MAPSALATIKKPGSAAITAPKPYSDAVFMAARSAPAIASLVPTAKLVMTGFQANAMTDRMPTSSAPSTAQMATTDEICCTTGAFVPITAGSKEWLSP